MSIFDPIRKYFSREKPRVAQYGSTRALAGGRASVDKSDDVLVSGLSMMVPFTHPQDTWRDYNLDSKTLDRVSPTRLMELLADLSPDISRALWDFLRFCNPGFTLKAYRVNSEIIDENAQAKLDEFKTALDDRHGSFDVVIGRIFFSAFIRGALCSELVLDKRGRLPLDLATPDPASLHFEKYLDPVLGLRWRMYQWQRGVKVYLDDETIRYVPIDPAPGSPYGRSLVSPALFTSLFVMGLLRDLRRVVAQQGYPRLDIVVNLENLRAAMPANAEANPEVFLKWSNEIIRQVEEVYEDLEPDDAYIHTDVVEMKEPKGVVDASSLGAIDGLIKGLERMSTRALKSNQLLMVTTEGVGEANSNRLWETYIQTIKSVQHYAETMLDRLFTLSLRVQGIEASAQIRFTENRASEEQRDELVRGLKLKNARTAYDNGLINQDEQALMALGKEKADQQEPRSSGTVGGLGPASGMVPDPGSERKTPLKRTVQISPEGSNDPLPDVPAEVEFSDSDVDRAVAEFDRQMEAEFQGLLSAEIVNREDYD